MNLPSESRAQRQPVESPKRLLGVSEPGRSRDLNFIHQRSELTKPSRRWSQRAHGNRRLTAKSWRLLEGSATVRRRKQMSATIEQAAKVRLNAEARGAVGEWKLEMNLLARRRMRVVEGLPGVCRERARYFLGY